MYVVTPVESTLRNPQKILLGREGMSHEVPYNSMILCHLLYMHVCKSVGTVKLDFSVPTTIPAHVTHMGNSCQEN